MRILVNATTLLKGGALYLSSGFIKKSLESGQQHEWHYAISPAVWAEVGELSFNGHANVKVISPSPSKLVSGRGSRAELLEIERHVKPDVVFTVFGPAYVNFKTPHVMGFADAFISHPNSVCWSVFSGWRYYLERYGREKYRAYRLQADWFAVETKPAKDGLVRNLHKPADRIAVITTAFPPVQASGKFLKSRIIPTKYVNILTIGADYPHKNYGIVIDILVALKKIDPDVKYKFTFTLNPSSRMWLQLNERAKSIGVAEGVSNLGPLEASALPDVYGNAQIVLQTSLIETLSAVYPEAMAFGRPLVATDFDFSRDTCGDAALFYQWNNQQAAAECIASLVHDSALYDEMVDRGFRRLKAFLTPDEKFAKQMQLLIRAVSETKLKL